MRHLAFDKLKLGKILKDDDDELVVQTVFASEIVQKYADGYAYKSADNLKRSAWTLNGRWIKLFDHPLEGTIQRIRDISGFTSNVRFVKNLIDPKTYRPNRRGIIGNIHFFKNDRNFPGATVVDEKTLAQIRSGDMCDVSVGFTYEKDMTAGDFNGTSYDYVQDNMFFDHVSAPVQEGRCPSPYCGIGMDKVGFDRVPIIMGDPWEKTEEYIRSGHKPISRYDPDSFRTEELGEGIKVIYACSKEEYENGECKVSVEIQSYLFPVDKFTVEQAKSWFEEHKGDQNMSVEECVAKCLESGKTQEECEQECKPEGDCDYCETIDLLGSKRFSALIVRSIGMDNFLTIMGEAKKLLSSPSTGDAFSHVHVDQEESEEYKAFIVKCTSEGKTLEECVAEWKARTPEEETDDVSVNELIERGKEALFLSGKLK